MKTVNIAVDPDDPQSPDFLEYMADCMREWQKPGPGEEAQDVKINTKTQIPVIRECIRCHRKEHTTQARGLFVCGACKNPATTRVKT